MLFPIAIFYLYFLALILFIFKIGPASGYDFNVNNLIKSLMGSNKVGFLEAVMNEKNIEKQQEYIKLLNKVLETREVWSKGTSCEVEEGGVVCKAIGCLFFIKKKNYYSKFNLQFSSFFILQIPAFIDGFKEYVKFGVFFLTALLFSLLLMTIT